MRFSHPRLVFLIVCEPSASWNAKTRLRPCSFAVRHATSASLMIAERPGARRVMATTPMLTVTWKAFSFHSNCHACTASRSCVAADWAKSTLQFSSSTANSSPPMRASISPSRSPDCITGVTRPRGGRRNR